MAGYGYAFCIVCGKPFIKKHPTMQIRCPDCQKEYLEMRQRERRKAKRKNKMKKDPHECTRKGSCFYAGAAGVIKTCDYMVKTGERRPCPVQGCTVYKRKRRDSEKGGENG